MAHRPVHRQDVRGADVQGGQGQVDPPPTVTRARRGSEALRAVTAANLTDAGYQRLIGSMTAEAPDAVLAALESVRKAAEDDPAKRARLFIDGGAR
ncbi:MULTISPECIES: hypothetical protein [unclassified Spirillospora]|uniref:hypothetical protein n=1 Tax=unclassified Spirillospora TaxID=2642701 RepID=UPI00371CAA6C